MRTCTFRSLFASAQIDLAVTAILFAVRRRIADRVLGAHLLLDLVEDRFEGILSIDLEHPSAGLFGHLLQNAFAAVAPAKRAIELAVDIEDPVDDRIRLLRSLDRGLQVKRTALILARR